MADASSNTSGPARGARRGGGSGGRGRGAASENGAPRGGGRGGRGRGRGRGGDAGGFVSDRLEGSRPRGGHRSRKPEHVPEELDEETRARLTEEAALVRQFKAARLGGDQATAAGPADGEEDDEGDYEEGDEGEMGDDDDNECWICTEEIVYSSLGKCNHRLCHVCVIRLRALYKDFNCPICKEPIDEAVFTGNHNATFESFLPLTQLPHHDETLKIWFDSREAYAASITLLRFHCPDPGCEYVQEAGGWTALKTHVHKAHGQVLCDICTDHKKIFSYEHTLYPPALLRVHRERGDDSIQDKIVNPDASFKKGHPSCGFCNVRFFGPDELFAHCRVKHEECFLCQRNGIRDVYYKNYAELENHFHEDHYPCMFSECLEAKFVVFDSDIDLRAHEAEAHPQRAGQRAHQQHARRIELDYEFNDAGSRRARGGRDGGRARHERRGTGNETAAPPRPSPSASSSSLNQAAGTDQQQQQQQQSKKKNKKKPAAGDEPAPDAAAASSSSAAAASASASAPPTRPVGRVVRPPPGFGELTRPPAPAGRSTPSPVPGANPGPNSAAAREAAEDRAIAASPLLQRMQALLDGSRPKLREFQQLSGGYMNGTLTAAEFMRALTDLVGQEIDRATIRAIIETCPDDSKRQALLTQVEDMKVQQKSKVLVIRPSSPSTSSSGTARGIPSLVARRPGWSHILPANRAVRAQAAKKMQSVWKAPSPGSTSPAASLISAGPSLAEAAVAAPAAGGKGKGKARAAPSIWNAPPVTPVPISAASSSSSATAARPKPAAAPATAPAAAVAAPRPSTPGGARVRNERDFPSLPASAPAPRAVPTPSWAAATLNNSQETQQQQGKGKKGKKNLLFRVGL
ncbi:hypothetical protein GGF31_001457 [Allomyces arbusculus]|nr:hypothetical protein GGF31_001457 [Allomyces arbusculus]